jgi:hypothetical protein
VEIKIKLQHLVRRAGPALRKIATGKFKGKLQLQLTRLLRETQRELDIWQETHDKIIRNYGFKNDKDQDAVPADKNADFDAQIGEILAVDVTLQAAPLSMTEMVEYDLEPLLLCDLGPLLCDDEAREDNADKTEST